MVVAWARALAEGRAAWTDFRPSADVGHRTVMNDAG